MIKIAIKRLYNESINSYIELNKEFQELKQSHKAEAETHAIGFADWLNNHWFVPTNDGWKIDLDHIECVIEPPAVNWFLTETLYKAFVENGSEPYGEFDHKVLTPQFELKTP